MTKTIKRVLTAGFALALILTPVAVVTAGVLPYRAYVVQTGSMMPMVPPASLVVVEVGEYEVGQAITFRKQGELVTHRLLSVNADGTLMTKGDANASADPTATAVSDVVGGVVYAPEGVGFWVMYLRNPLTVLSLVLWVVVVWFVWPREQESIALAPAAA